MKKYYIDFICALHGYSIRVKEIHWNTTSNAEHLICDEINNCISDFEDNFTECCMGIEGKHFQIGKLLPMLPNSESLIPLLKELEKDILKMKKLCNDTTESGLVNILDDAMQNISKYKYRASQK
jgi:hypothetical protein